ncbi:MAG: amino acid permease [Tannerellaceae bacterium]|jgi:amino acid transporter|nr:amino acid permease [Tannerellaceae bacterium]
MRTDNKPAITPDKGFGTAPVFFTAISTILGAILFLRFGYATGAVGFWGAVLIIILGHLVTIPTALAISEIATNTRVEGGGEYFIISRSFGLKIGSTIGITLYLSQAISIAFYVVAFTEAFGGAFGWWQARFGFELPRQAVSVPTLFILAILIIRKGSGLGMRMLYAINIILFLALALFFAGGVTGGGAEQPAAAGDAFKMFRWEGVFVWFAICFPAFTGMTAGVGLSGDLRNPGRSIPLGTMGATLAGFVIYLLVVWKLASSASVAELSSDQLIMARIAVLGAFIIPVGLAACTFSSALGSVMVAPRTIQALAADRSFPSARLNAFLSKGRGEENEPVNATIVSLAIALVFVVAGNVDVVAQIISMFFLITYGTLCLISFINHFGSPPSYRPRFKSKWYFSAGGFMLSVWLMFMINPVYTVISYLLLAAIYVFVEHYNRDSRGLADIFEGALFQLNRRLRVYMQKHRSQGASQEWRPSAICVSANSFERDKVLELMKWISHRHGFGTYFHFIEGYYSRQTFAASLTVLAQLIERQKGYGSAMYIDTMISPSYTSAIAQVIQAPSISGMENNMVVFEYVQENVGEINRIVDNINLAKAGDFDVCIFAGSPYPVRNRFDIHVWIRETDEKNTNLMILLGFIIIAHPDWSKSHIKIFITTRRESDTVKEETRARIAAGRLPITLTNIEIIILAPGQSVSDAVSIHSRHAGLTIIGFREEIIRHSATAFFTDFHGKAGDILFVNASQYKDI